MNENVIIFKKSVNNYFSKLNETINTLNSRIIPFVVDPVINGVHEVGFTEITSSGRMTMTSGGATIVRRGEMRDFSEGVRPSIYNAKVNLYLLDHQNPQKLANKMAHLKFLQNQDYLRIILGGAIGFKPLPQGKGDNLRGGLLNYAGSVLQKGEITSVDELVDFVNEASNAIDDIVDTTIDEQKLEGGGVKRYTLLMPSISGVGKTSYNTGHSFQTLKQHLLDVYNTDLVVVSSGFINIDKAILLPATEQYIYFHLDTFNEVYDWKPGDGQYEYEIHWRTAGVVVANPALIQTKKLKAGRLEGLISRDANVKVKITNDVIKTKNEGGTEVVGEAPKATKQTPNSQGGK